MKLKISGVPEHFNLPWHLAIEDGDFAKAGLDVQWTDVPEGTGKLCQMLRTRETDVAVILTEGIIKDINAGNPSKIVQVYVETPLIWGIHVGANSRFQTLADLENAVAAISRKGSGSELMAYVNAGNQGWDAQKLKFVVVHTIDGAVEALTNGTADYFMWEHFMTKPLVDSGVFRRVADCPTPWPCFVIAVRNEVLEMQTEAVDALLSVINEKTSGFRQIAGIDEALSKRYGQKTGDIRQWLSLTRWSQHNLSAAMLNNIQKQLSDLGIIDKRGSFADIVYD